MQCPKCRAAVGRKDMITEFGWASFVCPGCKVDLDATKASGAIIIVVALLIASAVYPAVASSGVGSIVSVLADAAAFFASAHLGFAHFSALEAHQPEHPSLLR